MDAIRLLNRSTVISVEEPKMLNYDHPNMVEYDAILKLTVTDDSILNIATLDSEMVDSILIGITTSRIKPNTVFIMLSSTKADGSVDMAVLNTKLNPDEIKNLLDTYYDA